METRTIHQVQIRIYKLCLNHMQSPKIEIRNVVAVSTSYESLVRWCRFQEAKEVWIDTVDGYNWRKQYKKGSYLEWYNKPCSLELVTPEISLLNGIDGGITDQWVNIETWENVKNSNSGDFKIIPEDF